MQKAYPRINWENYPSEKTALNETNLNRMDYGLSTVDDRVIVLDTTKANTSDIQNLIKDWSLDDETGVITITYYDNSTSTQNTNLNKIAVNFTYDRTTQSLILTFPDGTTTNVPLSDLVQDNDFASSPTIAFSVSGGTVIAQVREGSITENHLRTNFLADIRVSEANAKASEVNAEAYLLGAQSYAVGGSGTRTGEDEDNSQYYSQVASGQALIATQAMANAQDLVEVATARLTGLQMYVDFEDGNLYYNIESGIELYIDETTGNLMYAIVEAE